MADPAQINPAAAPGVARPQPTDPPGSDAGPWVKIASSGDGGWASIDDLSSPPWKQT